LERKGLQRADPKYGKFRSFLLACLKNFLADEWDRSHAQKRGGNKKVLSLDFDAAASRYNRVPAYELSPEKRVVNEYRQNILSESNWGKMAVGATLCGCPGQAHGPAPTGGKNFSVLHFLLLPLQ